MPADPSSRSRTLAALCLALVSGAQAAWASKPRPAPDASPVSAEQESIGQIEFDTRLRLGRVLTLPTTTRAIGVGLPSPIEFESVLVPATQPMPEIPVDHAEFSFLRPETGGADAVRILYERQTALVDGGFGDPPGGDEEASSYYESQGERFDRYALSLEWVPTGADADLQWLLIGGLHAIRADIGRLDPENASLGLTEARGMVAIPTVGTGFRWAPTDALSFSTTAATQSIERDASVLEVVFSARIDFSPFVGLTAGYEYYRSDLTVEDIQTSLDREGVFARLTIRF